MRKPFPSGSRPSRPGARWDDGVGGPPVERARAAAERGPAVGGAPDPAARPIREFRRTIEAIVWRQQNGAKWRAIPAELGPWWMAAQTFIRWAKLGVWERLHRLVQEQRGLELGVVFLDGTGIRAHQKAAGGRKQGRTPAGG